VRNRPDLRQAEAQVSGLDDLTSAARAQRLPLLTGVGSVGKINPSPLIGSSDKPWAVGIAVTIPVFTGGLVEGQVIEAEQNAAAARSSLAELTNSIHEQVISAIANLSLSEAALHVAEVEVAKSQDALSLATQRYQARLGSIVELGQAQVADADAQNDLVRAQYDRELARSALAFATGRDYTGAAVMGGS
jgi:outer membrane protein